MKNYWTFVSKIDTITLQLTGTFSLAARSKLGTNSMADNNYELNKEKDTIVDKIAIEDQILDLIRIIKKQSKSKNNKSELNVIRSLKRVIRQIK